MAFNTDSNNDQRGNGNNGSRNNDENWKATGFLNIFLPANDGSRAKLGAIPLKASKPREKGLADWLAGDDIPDTMAEEYKKKELAARIAKVVSKLEVEYASAEPTDGKGFDLS